MTHGLFCVCVCVCVYLGARGFSARHRHAPILKAAREQQRMVKEKRRFFVAIIADSSVIFIFCSEGGVIWNKKINDR